MSFIPISYEPPKPMPQEGSPSEVSDINRLIKVEVATENMEGGQWNAILLATIIAVLLFGGVLAFAINMYSQDKINLFTMILIGSVALVICGIIFWLLYQVFLGLYAPGESNVEVATPEEAVAKVTASKTTLFALASYALYKLFKR